MSKFSRDKGKRGQAEFAQILDRHGLEYVCEQDGRPQVGDFRFGPFAVDAKRRERLSLAAWSREIEAKVSGGIVPVIAYRPNNEPWRTSMMLTDWLELTELAEAVRRG